mmetsp:Transcript_23656/g.49273  ORF Transcript_23656/g.49273 Transcript_23656/m.49273 type:complete len:651 (-) Transcript_23656:46-1998(-)
MSAKNVLLKYSFLGRPQVDDDSPNEKSDEHTNKHPFSSGGGEKRKRQDDENDQPMSMSASVSASVSPTPSISELERVPFRVHYEAFEVHNPSTGTTSEVRVNSTVRVNSGQEGGNFFIALVEDVYLECGSVEREEIVGNKRRKMEGGSDVARILINAKDMASARVRLRWYFQARDIPKMGLSTSSSPKAKDLIDALSKTNSNGSRNIALTDLRDTNPLDVVMGLVDVPKEFVVSHKISVVPGSDPPSWEISKIGGGGSRGDGVRDGDEGEVDDTEEGMDGEESDSEDSTASSSSDETHNGKIYVGDNHQAVVPDVISDYKSARTPPTQVWKSDAGNINPKTLKSFISSCYDIIKGGIPESNDYNVVKGQQDNITFEDSLDFGDTVHPCDVSVLLEVLALNSYNVEKAKADVVSKVADFVDQIAKKKSEEATGEVAKGDDSDVDCDDNEVTTTTSPPTSPDPASTPLAYSNPTPKVAIFWTKNEKSLFDAGFKKHSGQLRNISLGLPSKSTSEVIDYHYRFKIPSQYRKYVEKKQSMSGGSTVSSSNNTPNRSTSNSPFEGGSGSGNLYTSTSANAAMDRRRHKQAKSFLSQCRRQLGPDAYLNVVNLLKSYSQKSIQMKNLREKVVKVIGQGELAKNFDAFLPKKHRGGN